MVRQGRAAPWESGPAKDEECQEQILNNFLGAHGSTSRRYSPEFNGVLRCERAPAKRDAPPVPEPGPVARCLTSSFCLPIVELSPGHAVTLLREPDSGDLRRQRTCNGPKLSHSKGWCDFSMVGQVVSRSRESLNSSLRRIVSRCGHLSVEMASRIAMRTFTTSTAGS